MLHKCKVTNHRGSKIPPLLFQFLIKRLLFYLQIKSIPQYLRAEIHVLYIHHVLPLTFKRNLEVNCNIHRRAPYLRILYPDSVHRCQCVPPLEAGGAYHRPQRTSGAFLGLPVLYKKLKSLFLCENEVMFLSAELSLSTAEAVERHLQPQLRLDIPIEQRELGLTQ